MPGGLFLGISIVAFTLFISLLRRGIRNSRPAGAPVATAAQPLPAGKNHEWIKQYEYKLSDFLPAPPAPAPGPAAKSASTGAQKKPAAAASRHDAADEMAELAQAELAAEAAHYAARAESEEQPSAPAAAAGETYDNPFDEPAPTATDKHNTTVKNQLRAKRAAAARNSRLAVAGDALTKSCPA